MQAQPAFACSSKKFELLNLYFDERKSFAARAAAGHFLLPIAAKGSKSAFCLPKQKSSNQRKVGFLPHARRRQLKSFILSLSNSKRFFAVEFFSFAVGLNEQAFTNSRRQCGGLYFIINKGVNALLFLISFPLPTCAAVGKESFAELFGFCCFCFDFLQITPQAVIFIFYQSVGVRFA